MVVMIMGIMLVSVTGRAHERDRGRAHERDRGRDHDHGYGDRAMSGIVAMVVVPMGVSVVVPMSVIVAVPMSVIMVMVCSVLIPRLTHPALETRSSNSNSIRPCSMGLTKRLGGKSVLTTSGIHRFHRMLTNQTDSRAKYRPPRLVFDLILQHIGFEPLGIEEIDNGPTSTDSRMPGRSSVSE